MLVSICSDKYCQLRGCKIPSVLIWAVNKDIVVYKIRYINLFPNGVTSYEEKNKTKQKTRCVCIEYTKYSLV